MTTVPGVGNYNQVRAVAKPFDAFGVTILALDLTELIISKHAAGRTKDQLQLPLIEATLRLRDLEAEQP